MPNRILVHRAGILLVLFFLTAASIPLEAALIDATIRQRYAEWDKSLAEQTARETSSAGRISKLKEIAKEIIGNTGLEVETKNERLFFVFEHLYEENPNECLGILEHVVKNTGKLWLKLYCLKNKGQVQWMTGMHESALQSFQQVIDLVKEHHSPHIKVDESTGIPEFEYRIVHAYGMVMHLAQTLNDTDLATATAKEYATSGFTNDLKQMTGVGASISRSAAIVLRRAGNEDLARSLLSRIPSDSGMYDADPKMRVVIAVERMGYTQKDILIRSSKFRELWSKPEYYQIAEIDSYCAAHFQDLVEYAESGPVSSNVWPHVLEFGEWYVGAMKKKVLVPPATYSNEERTLAKELWRANLGLLAKLKYTHGNARKAKALSAEYLKRFPHGGQKPMAEFIVSSEKNDDDVQSISDEQRIAVRLLLALVAALGLFLLVRFGLQGKRKS